jgi:hypothetical protein
MKHLLLILLHVLSSLGKLRRPGGAKALIAESGRNVGKVWGGMKSGANGRL